MGSRAAEPGWDKRSPPRPAGLINSLDRSSSCSAATAQSRPLPLKIVSPLSQKISASKPFNFLPDPNEMRF
jgi:hypothetical protein